MATDQPSHVMIVQSADIYKTIEALEEAGFEMIDKAMNRAAFADGDFKSFRRVVRASTEREYRRILRIPDPGLGICLFYPEDGYKPVALTEEDTDDVVVLRKAEDKYDDAPRPVGQGPVRLTGKGLASIPADKANYDAIRVVDKDARRASGRIFFDPALFQFVVFDLSDSDLESE